MPSLAVLPLLLWSLAQAEPAPPPDPLAALESALTRVIDRTESSVVAITRTRVEEGGPTRAIRGAGPAEFQRQPFDAPDLADPDFLPMPGDFGSGVVVGPHGEVLTAFHVVKGSARIHVRAAGRLSFDAEVIAADPRSDLAVIAPRGLPPNARSPLKPIPLGQAETMRKGSFVIALGNPFNTARDGTASASWGIVSNTMRKILPPNDDRLESMLLAQTFRHQPTLWQLDTKLNLGMSGGAIVNLKGELVGITTTGGNVEGFDVLAGYAVPMDALGRRVVEALVQGKEAEYGFLGIRLMDGTTNTVGTVEPGTPAAEGELLINDVILAVGDRPVTREGGLSLALSTAAVGERVRMKVLRNGQILEKSVLIAKYPTSGEVIATNVGNVWRGLRVDFTSAVGGTTVSPSVLSAMAKGLVSVLTVQSGSPAESAGLRKGQVITRVGDRAVRTPEEFRAAVADLKGPVTLQTDRGPVTIK